jgi:hypothetical protein
MTDTRCRRLLYLSLVRSHLSYASEIWAEGVQRRATKFILQNYELSYLERLRKLNVLPISYWLEIKDIIIFLQMQTRPLRPRYFLFVTFSSNLIPVQPLFLETLFLTELIVFLWNNLSPIILNSSSVSSFKLQLHYHYSSQLDSSFDVNRMRTWKTYCSKCRSFNLNCCS